ncbi:MAG: peptidylprolyl isomerase [Cellulosilyticaceae bacterium]
MKKVMLMGCISVMMIWGMWLYMSSSVEASSPMNPIATVYLSNGGSFRIELYPDYAPNTVANFISLADKGFYNQTYINRVMPNYLIQAGDPIGNGYGFPGYFIKSECRYNGYANKLKHVEGTVSMARGRDFDTEGSQFFVLLKDSSDLNGQYAAFGRVVQGLDVVQKVGNMGIKGDHTLVKPIWIESIDIDTQGKTYSEPSVISVEEQRAANE